MFLHFFCFTCYIFISLADRISGFEKTSKLINIYIILKLVNKTKNKYVNILFIHIYIFYHENIIIVLKIYKNTLLSEFEYKRVFILIISCF